MSVYDNYEIILSDSESLVLSWRDRMRMQTLAKLIVNFADCMDGNGRFKIGGTKYFWVETIKPGMVRNVADGVTEYYFDGLYRLKAYGGYECGGRGCFYEEVPTPVCA